MTGHTVANERHSHDHLDKLMAMAAEVLDKTGHVVSLFKADIDAAFRRIPIRTSDLWACAIVYLLAGQAGALALCDCVSVGPLQYVQAWVSTHRSCPFGALSAVHAWERVGALVAHVARKTLKLMLCRYVDDYFGCERCAQ